MFARSGQSSVWHSHYIIHVPGPGPSPPMFNARGPPPGPWPSWPTCARVQKGGAGRPSPALSLLGYNQRDIVNATKTIRLVNAWPKRTWSKSQLLTATSNRIPAWTALSPTNDGRVSCGSSRRNPSPTSRIRDGQLVRFVKYSLSHTQYVALCAPPYRSCLHAVEGGVRDSPPA